MKPKRRMLCMKSFCLRLLFFIYTDGQEIPRILPCSWQYPDNFCYVADVVIVAVMAVVGKRQQQGKN